MNSLKKYVLLFVVGLGFCIPSKVIFANSANLLTNPGAESDENINPITGWTTILNGGGLMRVHWDGTVRSGNHSFQTSYGVDSVKQTVDLLANGYTQNQLNTQQPAITTSIWLGTRGDQGGTYYITYKLLGTDGSTVIATGGFGTSSSLLSLSAGTAFLEKSVTFSNYGTGVRYVYFEFGGRDQSGWAGNYGTHFDDASVTLADLDTTAPTITSVSSDKANGSYTAGEVIDIDVTFSETVTSTGNVTVTLETGVTDRTCTFTVTSATTGTCNYTVQSGDTSSDLTVGSISGTIADTASNAMTSFVPAANLAANKALVIDGVAPILSETTPIVTPSENTTPTYIFTSDSAGTITYGGSCSSGTTAASVGANTIVLTALADGSYSNCTITVTDTAGNASTALAMTAFTITVPVVASSENPSGGGSGGPAPLPDLVKVASTSTSNATRSAESLHVAVDEKFTLRVKAPDADSVQSVSVKINGSVHVFTLEEIKNNPVFLSSLSLRKPGKYPYTVTVDYGSFAKRSLGTVIVRDPFPKKLPLVPTPSPEPTIQTFSARLIASPRTSITQPSPKPEPQAEPGPQAQPTSSSAPIPKVEERILDIQLSTIFNRTTQGSRSLLARAVTSSKSVVSTFINVPKRLWSRIAKQFQNNRYEKMTIRLASASGDPLIGATVIMHSEPRTGITDNEGTVTFYDVERGKHELDITYQEYKTKQEVILNHDVLEVTINITAEFRKE